MQDFSENYTCVVPDEVQSLHWAQAQVTILPVVTFQRDEDKNLIEDHLVFLSDDKIHDSAFVELVNNKIHIMKNRTLLQIMTLNLMMGVLPSLKVLVHFGYLIKEGIVSWKRSL